MSGGVSDPLLDRTVIIRSCGGIAYAGIVRSITAHSDRGELFELVGNAGESYQRLVFVADRRAQVSLREREAVAYSQGEEPAMDRTLHDLRNHIAVAVGTLHGLIDGKFAASPERLGVVLRSLTALDAGLLELRPVATTAKEQLLGAVIEGSPYAKILVDARGAIVLVNSQTEQLFGYDRAELLGRSIEMLVPDRLRDGHSMLRVRFFCAPVARPMGAGRDLYGRRKDGSEIPIEIGLNPVPAEGQTFTLAAITDISERRSSERLRLEHAGMSRHAADLERLNAELQTASRFKTEFVSTMSHELRTPLSAIIGGTQLLESSALDVRDRAIVQTIAKASEALLALVSSVLDFSKIEAGKLELQLDRVDLESVVEGAADVAAQIARRKPVIVYSYVDPRIPSVYADRDRLRQIFLNLLGNAVKFSDAGKVVIRADILDETAERVGVRFEVQDDGVGIADELIPKIFEPFAQADRSASRRFGGTGLGLSICRRLVELMGGRIAVRSELRAGSTFTFALSFERAREHVSLEQLPTGVRATILSRDDLFADIVERYLESWSVPVARVRELGDLGQMPADAGWRNVTIADVEPGDVGPVVETIERAFPSGGVILVGAQQTVGKPIRRSQLYGELMRYAPLPERRAVREQSTMRPIDERIRVLVAEDNEQLQTLLQLQFDQLGAGVSFVSDGCAAVEAVKRERFSLVFMDCQMPELDGFDATRRIRAEELERGGHVPIVAMTANAFAEDRDACLRAGMDDFLSKPVLLEALASTIERWTNGECAGGA